MSREKSILKDYTSNVYFQAQIPDPKSVFLVVSEIPERSEKELYGLSGTWDWGLNYEFPTSLSHLPLGIKRDIYPEQPTHTEEKISITNH